MISGANSRDIESVTAKTTWLSAPKVRNRSMPCIARVTPIISDRTVAIGKARMPISIIWLITEGRRTGRCQKRPKKR